MRIYCPQCNVCYELDETLIPEGGRKLRCSNCGEVFRFDKNGVQIQDAMSELQKLMQEYNITQDQVASRIGKNRSSIANYVRLLSLYPEVIDMVEKGKVSHGHAKCLVAITDYPTQFSCM